MRSIQRTLSLLTVVLLLASLMSACGTPAAPVQTSTAAPQTAAPQTAAPTADATAAAPQIDTGKVIKMSISPYSQYPIDNESKYVKIMEEKYKLDLDIWQCYGDEYSNQLNARIAGGEVPDIIGSIPNMNDYVNQGLIIEVKEDFIKQYMPEYYAMLYEYSDMPFAYSKINDKIYGFPGTSADGQYHFTIIWRSDWLKKVGIDKVPETLDECEAAFYKFAKDDPDGNGKADTYGLSNLGMIPVFGAFGCIPYNNRTDASFSEKLTIKDGKVVCAATQPEMKEALKLLNKWYTDGVVDPECITGERKEGHWSASQAFASGRIGFTSCGMYYNTGRTADMGYDGRAYKLFRSTQDALGITTSDYVHGKPPVGPDGKSGTIRWGVEEGVAYSFGKPMENDLEKQARAAIWFNDIWMNHDSYMSTIYGVKGEDWTQDPTTGELQKGLGPDTKVPTENDEVNKLGLGFVFVIDIAPSMMAENPRYYKFADQVAKFTDNYTSPVGSAPLASVEKYKADLGPITLTSYNDMITGKQPIDTYFDQYVQTWMDAGGAEIIKEANDWYAANVAAK